LLRNRAAVFHESVKKKTCYCIGNARGGSTAYENEVKDDDLRESSHLRRKRGKKVRALRAKKKGALFVQGGEQEGWVKPLKGAGIIPRGKAMTSVYLGRVGAAGKGWGKDHKSRARNNAKSLASRIAGEKRGDDRTVTIARRTLPEKKRKGGGPGTPDVPIWGKKLI